MNSLAHALERDTPALAVPFTNEIGDEALLDVVGYVDVAEFRADYFQDMGKVNTALNAERIACFFPTLVTVRMMAEAGGNGGWIGSERERLAVFHMLRSVADGFDVELEAPILGEVIDLAKQAGKVAVVSSHDFEKTPSLDELDDRLGRAKAAGADYFKLAAVAPTLTAYKRLRRFTRSHANDNVIAVGMGEEFGPRSRIELPGLGSRLTFAAGSGSVTAAGQMGYIKTHRLLCKAYPGYANLYKYGA